MSKDERVLVGLDDQKYKGLNGKKVIFSPEAFDTVKKNKLLFTSDFEESKDLGTGEIRFVKRTGSKEDQNINLFAIIKFEKERDTVGVMLGDLKEAVKNDEQAPDPFIEGKEGNSKIGYTLNPNAKFGYNAQTKDFIVQS